VTYHRIIAGGPKENRVRPSDSVFTWEFEQQIEYLVRHYHVATGEEVRLFLTEERSLPDNSVFVTFDDGYENNFIEAFPILRRYGATAAFFLTTGLIGKTEASLWFDKLDRIFSQHNLGLLLNLFKEVGLPGGIQNKTMVRGWIKGLTQPQRDTAIEAFVKRLGADENGANGRGVTNLMTWDQVREMANGGMTIGSHTVSHQILASATSEQVAEELVSSRLKIEKETDRPCWCFAYPNGESRDFRVSDKTALQLAGYTCAFTQIPGFITAKTDRYALPRIPIPGSKDIGIFASRVTGVHNWLEGLRFSNGA
jgi:peptidoglycan/xylan/chitin deacetylase (PgdA/CDA1 family)